MNLSLSLLLCNVLALPAFAEEKSDKETNVHALKVKSLDGKTDLDLSEYKGKVLLFVNVASQCGYTPQYTGLQKLHDTYKDQGLVVIGVPCNQFGKQEPGTALEIQKFCETNYSITFPMTEKVEVKGKGQCDLYKTLTTSDAADGTVKWNFEKFLVGRDGTVVGHYRSAVKPDSKKLTGAIETELKKKS